MPTFYLFHSHCHRSINILAFSLLLLTLFATNVLTPPKTYAATDPINATVSATARVPSATPTTSDTTAPSAVFLISPHDGATTNQSHPELVWKTTFDSNSNSVSYTVYLNGVATYLGVSNTGNSQQNNYISHIGDGNIYLTPTIDLPQGNYDWYVRATDGSNNSSYSTTWRFTIDQTPPPLTVINIDDQYLNPTITEGAIFDLAGPQEVKVIFATEAYATVSITTTKSNDQIISYSLPTTNSGLATLLVELPLGQNSFVVTSFDSAGLTTTLPTFVLNLRNSPYPGIIDPGSLPIVRTLGNIPNNLISLPATISQIKDENMIALLPYILIAVSILLLLIFIWQRRCNILIIDHSTSKPYRSLILYHSRPTHSAKLGDLASRVFVTSRTPIMYELGNTGLAYIRNLARYSSLTIRTPDGLTHILSICNSQKKYYVKL